MNDPNKSTGQASATTVRRPYRLLVPWTIKRDEVGLGDIIRKAASSIGFKHCDACERRAGRINEWIVFSTRRGK
jgi:hypothetical protein